MTCGAAIKFYVKCYPAVYVPLLERRRNRRVVFYAVLCEKCRTQRKEVNGFAVIPVVKCQNGTCPAKGSSECSTEFSELR